MKIRMKLRPLAVLTVSTLLLFSLAEQHEEGEVSTTEAEEEVEPAYAVLFPWFAQVVGIFIFYLLTRQKMLHGVPYTCAMFVVGMIMGVCTVKSKMDDQLTKSIALWRDIDSEVMFTVFLPGLLFKDSFEINFHLFQASFNQLLLLAFPMVLCGAGLTAAVGFYIFPYNWSKELCWTFGSILAATDPVAVAALLNEVGGPPRLKMHIAGESLLNDGSAVVFYTVFSSLYFYSLGVGIGEDISVADGFKIFVRMSLGGTAVGIAFALGLILILYKLERRFEQEETVLQVAATVTIAYLSFYTSEVVCHMSGVIAVVACGVITKAFGSSMISDWQVMNSFWTLLEHLLNSLLFVLGGIEFGFIIAEDEWNAREWGYLFVLFLLLNVIRFFLMLVFYPVFARIGIKTSPNEVIFSSWAGLRGAVGIALALGLDSEVRHAVEGTEFEYEAVDSNRLFGMVGGVAFLTLVINGTLSGPLLIKLGLAESTESRKRIIESAEEATRRRMLDDFIHLMTDSRFHFIDFAVVQHHVGTLKNLTAKELETAIEQNKAVVHPNLYKLPNLQNVLPYIPDSEYLRRDLERAQRNAQQNFFMAPGEELPAIRDKIPKENSSKGVALPALVHDTRIMFIELLRASYNAQIRDGELDPREDNGFLSYSLLQSLEFAHDEAVAGKPLNDWDLSQIVSNEFVDQAQDKILRCFDSICVMKGSAQERLHNLKMQPLQYQRLRLTVLRAFSFLDAHKEAEDRLQDEFGGSEGDIKIAYNTVLEESNAQVKKAEAVLRSRTKKQLKNVISHYLCLILYNKSARYINLLVNSGILLPRETRKYLEEIEHGIFHIRHCDMESHPGTIKVVKENENEAEQPPLRRRRARSNSIL